MGASKRLFEEQQERQEEYTFDELEELFEPQFMTFDVRVRAQISLDHLDQYCDKVGVMRTIKKDLRRKMRSQFNKELTRQIKDMLP